MEIERKFLIEKEKLPPSLDQYPCRRIEQGYLCTDPVVRIRQEDDTYLSDLQSRRFSCQRGV